jgi:protein-tyrosine phosphatase
MIDVHTHILPEVDDGAGSLEESQAMIALAAEDGITDMVATPHCDFRYNFDPQRCGEQLELVRNACPTPLRLYLGCEMHLSVENIERLVAKPDHYTLNSGDCLLLELPDRFTAVGIEAGLSAFRRKGLRTVIAHPERNPHLQRNPAVAERLAELGCYFQVTAQSLSGSFGPAAKKSAAAMLKKRLVHFVASDCHGVDRRRPQLKKAYEEIVHEFGESTAELLFVQNPNRALQSQAINTMRPEKAGSAMGRLFHSANIFIKRQLA